MAFPVKPCITRASPIVRRAFQSVLPVACTEGTTEPALSTAPSWMDTTIPLVCLSSPFPFLSNSVEMA